MDNHVITGLRSLFSGTYSFSSASNGYGTLSVTSGLGSTKSLGIYATDPTLNLNDPNSPTGGGGDLVLDLSLLSAGSLAGGTGVLIPQTDTATASFAGNYVAGWQNFNTFTNCNSCEFDMLAQGSMTEGALNLTGDISDPFKTWSETTTASTGNNFYDCGCGIARDLSWALLDVVGGFKSASRHPLWTNFPDLDLVMYQVNGGQLYWLDFDSSLPVSPVYSLDHSNSKAISAEFLWRGAGGGTAIVKEAVINKEGHSAVAAVSLPSQHCTFPLLRGAPGAPLFWFWKQLLYLRLSHDCCFTASLKHIKSGSRRPYCSVGTGRSARAGEQIAIGGAGLANYQTPDKSRQITASRRAGHRLPAGSATPSAFFPSIESVHCDVCWRNRLSSAELFLNLQRWPRRMPRDPVQMRNFSAAVAIASAESSCTSKSVRPSIQQESWDSHASSRMRIPGKDAQSERRDRALPFVSAG